MTDIVDTAVQTGNPGHIRAAEDYIEYHRNRRDALASLGWSTAQEHEEFISSARSRLEDAMTDDPQTVDQARRNRDLSRLRDAVDGVGEPETITAPSDPVPDEQHAESGDEDEPENPDGSMFFRPADRYASQSHRGL